MHRPILLADPGSAHGYDVGRRDPRLSFPTDRTISWGLGLLCLVFGVMALYFHTQYLHEAQRAVRTESGLRSRIDALNKKADHLQVQATDLSRTLEQTKAALVVALRPEVSTSLPTPKDVPPLRR